MAKDATINVQVTGLAQVRSELKALKGDLINATDPAEIERLSKAAGQLSDKIADANEKVRVFAAGSEFEKIGNGLGLIGTQLSSLDFEGAAESAKLLTTTIKNANPAEIAKGFKALIGTVGELGKAFFQMGLKLLANPLFLLVAVVAAIVVGIVVLKDKVKILGDAFDVMMIPLKILIQGLKDLADWIGITSFAEDEATDNFIKNAEKRKIAGDKLVADRTDQLSREIALLKAQGKETTELEVQQAAVRGAAAEKRLKDLQEEREVIKENMKSASKDRAADLQKRLDEITKEKDEEKKIYKDSVSAVEVIQATADKKNADNAKKRAEELLKLQKEYAAMRITVARQLRDSEINAMEDGLFKELVKNQEAYNRRIEDVKRNEKILGSEKKKLYAAFYSEKLALDKKAYLEDDKVKAEADKKKLEEEKKFQEELIKVRDNFNDFITEHTGTALQKEISSIRKAYDTQQKDLDDALAKKLITQEEYFEKSADLINAKSKDESKIRKSYFDAEVEAIIQTVESGLTLGKTLLDNIASLTSQNSENRIKQIQTRADAESEILERQRQKELSNVNLTQAQREAIDKKYALKKYQQDLINFQKLNEIKKKQFAKDKAFRLAGAIIDTASATIAAFADGAKTNVYLGIAYAAIAAAAGVVQIAAISNQKYEGESGPTAPSSAGTGISGGVGSSEAITPKTELRGQGNQLNNVGANGFQDEAGRPILVQAFVSETEMTATQNRVSRIEQSAKL